MCKSNTSTSICNLVLQSDGTLKCTKHNSTTLAGRLYNEETVHTAVGDKTVGQTTMDFTKRDQTFASNTNHREPDTITNATNADKNQTNITAMGLSTYSEFLAMLNADFVEMATSVAKYKGFYVARYEAGGTSGKSMKNSDILTTAATAGTNYTAGNMWYGVYKKLRYEINVDGVITTIRNMIWRKPV